MMADPESITRDIITAVAEARNVEPTEFGYNLNEYIDGDAIETLASHDASTWILSFELPDGTVIINSDIGITVEVITKSETDPHASGTDVETLGHCPHCGESFKRDLKVRDRTGYSLLGKGDDLSLVRCTNCGTELPVPEKNQDSETAWRP